MMMERRCHGSMGFMTINSMRAGWSRSLAQPCKERATPLLGAVMHSTLIVHWPDPIKHRSLFSSDRLSVDCCAKNSPALVLRKSAVRAFVGQVKIARALTSITTCLSQSREKSFCMPTVPSFLSQKKKAFLSIAACVHSPTLAEQ